MRVRELYHVRRISVTTAWRVAEGVWNEQ